MSRKLSRIEAVKDLIQEVVDKGARSVEDIHKTIADLPLSVLADRGLLGEDGEKLRSAQSQTIGKIYDAIRRVNKDVGELATGIFESLDDHADAEKNLKRTEEGER